MVCSVCYILKKVSSTIYQTQINNNVKLDTDFETETEFRNNIVISINVETVF
jgi:hypothetical protein